MIAANGTSFDDFTQETVNTIFSHVNAVKRKQFNGKSAYEMFLFTYSTELAELFGITRIDPKCVIQPPLLFKNYCSGKFHLASSMELAFEIH